MADAIVQHLDAVRGFLGQLGDPKAIAKVAGAQKVHLEQLLAAASFSIVDAMKVAHFWRGTFFFTNPKSFATDPKAQVWVLSFKLEVRTSKRECLNQKPSKP